MIDKLKKYSQSIRFLRLPAIAVGIFCLIAAIFIIFAADPNLAERFLVPSIVGVVWAMSIYGFIANFQYVPEKADSNLSIFGKIKRYLHRGWYWATGVLFLCTTLAVVYFTSSIVSIWLREYAQ